VHQNKKLLEIQELQTDYLEDLMKEAKKNKWPAWFSLYKSTGK
jgi:hypothetical protein